MSLQYMEQSNITLMREPDSVGVYRILKCDVYHKFSDIMNPRTRLIDHKTFHRMMGTPGVKVCWYSNRMMFMESNFDLEKATH